MCNTVTPKAIAIIGISCRFPGAVNYDAYWNNLVNGKCAINEIPSDRWTWKDHWMRSLDESSKQACKWGGMIDEIACFDARFFHISGKEAERMDPQQRIMLELTWACLEDAGICPSDLSGTNTGVYLGVSNFDYKELLESMGTAPIEAYYSTGTATAVIPNRISYYFNWKGPSLPVDTACSSSLHAIHLAAQALMLGECDLVLAGGVSLLLTPTRHIAFAKAGMLSATGTVSVFDEKADGYIRGEGAGLLLLKPLDKALEDGNSVYGVLKGSAVNHGGKAYTVTYPNPEAQAAVIITAMRDAAVTPEMISYVEAHGTGTPKGDPIELEGLLKAFRSYHIPGTGEYPGAYCGLGSVKANIGHLESAAGVAGVIKVLLAMKYRKLPAQLNFNRLNPRIDISNSPFYIVDKLREWHPVALNGERQLPRRAGISSFGFGGTNAHIILEESPVIQHIVESNIYPAFLICLSAKNESALQRKMADLLTWLDGRNEEVQLSDISLTLLLGREHFEVRVAFVVSDIEALKKALRESPVWKNKVASSGKAGILPTLYKELEKSLISSLSEKRILSNEEYINKLRALAELYLDGHTCEWNKLFPGFNWTRLHLPAYPFSREQYWIAPDEPSITLPTGAGFNDTFYDQLIDQVMDGVTSINMAVRKINKEN